MLPAKPNSNRPVNSRGRQVSAIRRAPIRSVSRHAEDEGVLGLSREGPRLQGRHADGAQACQVEDHGKALQFAPEQRLYRFWGHVAGRKARAARRQNHIYVRVLDPDSQLAPDGIHLVVDDGLPLQHMARRGQTFDQRAAGRIGGFVAGVRDGQHCDVQRVKRQRIVNSSGHQ